ncbi:Gfo/Idh/MocA family protein [Microbacterium sp. CPCC 204701]|uniref:Gfo/Idh/MocA family protein n=1 Tax=Microbacterium sp. CPCC 204701 TaxID=2493084 RepID=UPI000FDC7F05|nr:Gfo/Idh/MocA family oxidoreductase [Microbacterium sp. CPCC 204701]
MIRLATIGTSAIVRTFLGVVRGVDGIVPAVAYSRDLDRARAFAADNGVAEASADLHALLSSGEVDAVYIASPNALHHAQALRVLRAGRHAFIEKPATLTAGEFAELVDEAAAHGAVVFEAMRSAYDPAFDEVRRLLPELGVVRAVSFSYCQRSARYDRVLAGERVNIFDPALGGGALNDLGVYAISALVDLFGEPTDVSASTIPIASGADGAGAALLRYDGFVAEVSYSKIAASARPSEIQGERATLEIDHIAAPARLTLRRADGTAGVHEIRDAAANTGAPELNMEFEVRRFLDLVAGADAAPDHARTLAALRTLERVRAHSSPA